MRASARQVAPTGGRGRQRELFRGHVGADVCPRCAPVIALKHLDGFEHALEEGVLGPAARAGHRGRENLSCLDQAVFTASRVFEHLTIAGVRKPVALAEVSAPVNAGGTAKLRLPISARTRAAVTRALRRNRRVRAAVKVSVSDATGGRGVVAFQVLGSR